MKLVVGNGSSSSLATEKDGLVNKREEKGERIRETLLELNAIHLQIMEFGS